MRYIACRLFLLTLLPFVTQADPNNPNTEWFKSARYGVFMHFLPGDTQGLALVEQFDVTALARQLEAGGAKYFIFTLGQKPPDKAKILSLQHEN